MNMVRNVTMTTTHAKMRSIRMSPYHTCSSESFEYDRTMANVASMMSKARTKNPKGVVIDRMRSVQLPFEDYFFVR